jgi:hypothetical protein
MGHLRCDCRLRQFVEDADLASGSGGDLRIRDSGLAPCEMAALDESRLTRSSKPGQLRQRLPMPWMRPAPVRIFFSVAPLFVP